MLKYTMVTIAALGLLAYGPAIASGKPKSDAGVAKEGQAPAASAPTRYCYKIPAVTGTLLDRKVCKTLDQWRAEGVDPTKPQSN